MIWKFPKIYPILDSSLIPAEGRSEFLRLLGASLADAGVTLLEYRNKNGAEGELLGDAEILRGAMPAGQGKVILGDRGGLGEGAGFDGGHVDGGGGAGGGGRGGGGGGRIVGAGV